MANNVHELSLGYRSGETFISLVPPPTEAVLEDLADRYSPLRDCVMIGQTMGYEPQPYLEMIFGPDEIGLYRAAAIIRQTLHDHGDMVYDPSLNGTAW